jgi:hypothetical protein
MKRLNHVLLIGLLILSFSGCSSTPGVKSQAYAKLQNERTYEYDFPTVWKGIEEAVRKYKVTDRDPKEVGIIEMKSLTQRSLETDWIYTQSRDKFYEFQVNHSPRKIYLQSRFKYTIDAKRVLGGVHVKINTDEEIERLNMNGTPAGYASSDEPDPNRAGEFLDKIKLSILSLPNTD